MEKLFEKVGRELYSLHQCCFLQYNALHFMITKFRAGELHSCLHYSIELPCSLGGDFDIWRSRVSLDYTIAIDKSARQSLQYRACRFGLKFSSRRIHLVASVKSRLFWYNSLFSKYLLVETLDITNAKTCRACALACAGTGARKRQIMCQNVMMSETLINLWKKCHF